MDSIYHRTSKRPESRSRSASGPNNIAGGAGVDAGIKILVVDDEEAIRVSIAHALTAHGMQVRTAADGMQALELMQEEIPDLILADIMMPHMNGYQFYMRVRSNPNWTLIPFIFLSALIEDQNIRYGKELGADDYLQKPVSVDDLLAAVLGRLKRFHQLKDDWETRPLVPEMLPPKLDQDAEARIQLLSPRELQVLRLMIEGLNNTEIAERLFISPSTVKTHVSHILDKLNVSNRVEAVRYALDSGYSLDL
jgi:DNA-binding NarL/FixJ family response regulator